MKFLVRTARMARVIDKSSVDFAWAYTKSQGWSVRVMHDSHGNAYVKSMAGHATREPGADMTADEIAAALRETEDGHAQ
jgi:hypothetical protein